MSTCFSRPELKFSQKILFSRLNWVTSQELVGMAESLKKMCWITLREWRLNPLKVSFWIEDLFFLEQIVCLSTLCNVFTAPAPTVEVAAPTTPPSTQIARPEVVLEDRTEAIKGIRRAMAKAMTASLTIPHFGYKDEVILNELVR